MTAHPNAQILAQLAEIAKTDPEPWKRLEMKGIAEDWVECPPHIALLDPNATFRIKPANVNIGGVELEGPIKEAPKDGTAVWLLFDHVPTPGKPALFFTKMRNHVKWLNEGRLFATKEARDKYQDALVKLANGETN